MKKQLFIATAIITLLTGGIFAAEQNIPPEIKAMLLDKASRQAQNYIPAWEQLYSCTPAKTDDGSLIVYGKLPNKKCHFKNSKYNCRVPLDITQQYASAGLKELKEISVGNFSTTSAENDFMDKIHNNEAYCVTKK